MFGAIIPEIFAIAEKSNIFVPKTVIFRGVKSLGLVFVIIREAALNHTNLLNFSTS